MEELREYYLHHFYNDLRMIEQKKANELCRKKHNDPNLTFWGGREWQNCEKDLSQVDDKEKFILFLFLMHTTDIIMHSEFREHYQIYRDNTKTPKFAWEGYCCCFENPYYIICKPIELGLITCKKLKKLIPDFIELWFEESEGFHRNRMPEVNYIEFFYSVVLDCDLQKKYCENSCHCYNLIFDAIKDKLKSLRAQNLNLNVNV